jgi:hypothetical protein
MAEQDLSLNRPNFDMQPQIDPQDQLRALSAEFQRQFGNMAFLAPPALSEVDRHDWTVLQKTSSMAECMARLGEFIPSNERGFMGGVSSVSRRKTASKLEEDLHAAGRDGVAFLTAESRRIATIPESAVIAFASVDARRRALEEYSAFDPFISNYEPNETTPTLEEFQDARERLADVLYAMDETSLEIFS